MTECFNDARDKGKYLEALNRFFVQMSSAAISPSEMVDTVVPQLFQHVKNLESLSKHYARTGFLGLIIFQVSTLPGGGGWSSLPYKMETSFEVGAIAKA